MLEEGEVDTMEGSFCTWNCVCENDHKYEVG